MQSSKLVDNCNVRACEPENMMYLGFNRAGIQVWKEFWYEQFIDDECDQLQEFCPKYMRTRMREYLQTRQKNRYKFALITINPREGTNIAEFSKKIQKATGKVWIKDFSYVYEWRNIDLGLHVHIKVAINEDKNPYRIKGEFYNTFKHLVGNKKHVDVRYSNRKDCFEKYLRGLKKGLGGYEPKKTHIYDIEMRKKYNLEDIYISNCS